MANFEPEWFVELTAARGRASTLDPDLRTALELALGDRAKEQAAQARTAARQDERRRRDAERAERAAASQARRQYARTRVRRAFGLLWGRLGLGALLVALTPVGASFVTVSPIGEAIERVVFFPGETGSVAGSGPFTLYAILFWVTLAAVLALLFIDLVIAVPSSLPSWGAILGALVGLGGFILQWYNNELIGASWAIAPACLVVGYLIHAILERLDPRNLR